jgi:hypothetical protein
METLMKHKPDEICEEFANKGTQVTLKMLEDDVVLFEGTANALEFLGKLFLSVAADQNDTGFQISPSGPGSLLFSEKSKLGIYIHRLEDE